MITTTIKKIYFDMKMKDLEENGYFIEFKEQSPFWKTRIEKLIPYKNKTDLILLVGKTPYRFEVIDIFIVHKDFIPSRYSNAVKTEYVYAIKCVRKV